MFQNEHGHARAPADDDDGLRHEAMQTIRAADAAAVGPHAPALLVRVAAADDDEVPALGALLR